MSTYVGQAVNVEGQPLGHGEHLNGESAFLRQAINRQPMERAVNRTTGNMRTYSLLSSPKAPGTVIKSLKHFALGDSI